MRQYGGRARLLAGGTDLIVQMKKGKMPTPACLVNMKRIPGLSGITLNPGHIRVGALTTLEELGHSPIIKDKARILSEAALIMGGPPIRNLATIGGNLCNASPAADLAPPLLALDAQVTIAGNGQTRQLPLMQFFTGPGQTCLKLGEILAEITVPEFQPPWGSHFIKHGFREAMAIAVVGTAARIDLDDRGKIRGARLALGAVAPTPIRVERAEECLLGMELDDKALDEAAEEAVKASRPISDIRASATYRLKMIRALTKRALKTAYEEAKKG